MKVYVVTADGYCDTYGVEIYLIGVFDSLEAAEKAQANNDDLKAEYGSTTCAITEVELNSICDLSPDPINLSYENELYLGGYAE